jgi:two-component system chemotaxis response regulator CheB
MSFQGKKIRVLIVDDSAIVRKVLTESLDAETDLEVVGSAPDPFVARDKILALRPDVLTLDIEMPRMDGLTFLRKLMHFHPLPVIVISSLGQSSCKMAVEALRLGAVEVLAKPSGPYSVGELRLALAQKIRAAAAASPRIDQLDTAAEAGPPPPLPAGSANPSAVIAIGASTGGTEAIQRILTALPADSPAVVIAQHIPAVFSRAFADRLDSLCPLEVREASDGDLLTPGRALIAPGDMHMLVRRVGGISRIAIKTGPRVNYQRPSIDVLFSSVAETNPRETVGVLLTGMGSDGAQGLLKLQQAGAHTVAQDEASCVVFGMPREAIRIGAACQVLPLNQIGRAVLQATRARAKPAPSKTRA